VLRPLLAAATLAQPLMALQTPSKTETLLLCERSYRERRNCPYSGAPAVLPVSWSPRGKIVRRRKSAFALLPGCGFSRS
jgi:hypothetical protein